MNGITTKSAREKAAEKTGDPYRVIVGSAPLFPAPDERSQPSSMVLFGERFQVISRVNDAWVRGHAPVSGTIGFLKDARASSVLEGPYVRPTHRVAQAVTPLYATSSMAHPPIEWLPMNALVAVERLSATSGRYARIYGGGWVLAEDLVPLETTVRDWVGVAELLHRAPFGFGGRSSHLGINCMGVVQIALVARGIHAPHHSVSLESVVQQYAEPCDSYARGSVVFWERHAGVMVDDTHLLHATAKHNRVVIEPLATVVAEKQAKGFSITSVAHIPS